MSPPPEEPPRPPAASEADIDAFLSKVGITEVDASNYCGYFTSTPGKNIDWSAGGLGQSIDYLGPSDFSTAFSMFTSCAPLTITSLNLQYNDLGDARAADLAEVITFSGALDGLTSLNLGNTNLNDAGPLALAIAFQQPGVLPNLTSLNMMFNSIREAGGSAIAAALQAGALPSLDILKINAQGTVVGSSSGYTAGDPFIGFNTYQTCKGATVYSPSNSPPFNFACVTCPDAAFCSSGLSPCYGLPDAYPCGPARYAIFEACYARRLTACSN